MFHHIVLLRFTDESTLEQHLAILDALRALPARIDEITSYEVHLDTGLSNDNAHISVHGTYVNEAAWRAYSSHPAHVAVLEGQIKPILAQAVRTQYID